MLMPRWNDNQHQNLNQNEHELGPGGPMAIPVHHQPRHASALQVNHHHPRLANPVFPPARGVRITHVLNGAGVPPAIADQQEFPPLPGSRAVPIIDPHTRAEPPSLAQEIPIRSSTHLPRAKPQFGKFQNESSSQSSGSPQEASAEGMSHELSVFARPFISEALLVINGLAGREVQTQGAKEIDFDVYIGRCFGRDFLPVRPKPILPPAIPSTGLASMTLSDDLTHDCYETYFSVQLEEEIKAQKAENESYALFGHSIEVIADVKGFATCSILVPGLRENSPYVEENDIIELRELLFDPCGNMLGMKNWMAPPDPRHGNQQWPLPGGRWRGEPAPGWTGSVYYARVLAVVRKENRLIVRIDGSPQGQRWGRSPPGSLRFNIQFPLPTKRYQPMKFALPLVQDALRYADRTRYPHSTFSTCETGIDLPSTPWLQTMLFPIEADCETQTKLNPGNFKQIFFDEQLNWEQKKAIESICSRNYGTLPFLVSGPPGTGKTKTLVEVALQLVNNSEGVSHVLFCAPSDPAADMIVQRLSKYFSSTQLLRLNRSSRPFAEVPGAVLPFCCIWEDRFDLPRFPQIMACKLVITTCRDASLLLHSRLSNEDLITAEYGLRSAINSDAAITTMNLHWTALLIDEAAQAMEPEALIALSVVAPPISHIEFTSQPLVIMAGDEHQFGPRTSLPSSPLKTSLFARLFARPVYAEHPLSRGKSGERAPKPLKQTMLPILRPAFANLIRNYRSHPAILAVPSQLFYFDTLEPEAADTDHLAPWFDERGWKWPVVFHNNTSKDSMDLKNGGWSNNEEARIACEYAKRLADSGMAQKEICIMSPFKAQVARLRTIARTSFCNLWAVDIGPTEAFQGLERSVVILCTTRSQQRFVSSDIISNQGIIGLPKTMNVAMTRAKHGLVVIGHRSALLTDTHWQAFIEFCDRNDLVAGDKAADLVEQKNGNFGKAVTRLEKVLLARENDRSELEEEHGEDDKGDEKRKALGVYPQEDPMWRDGVHAEMYVGPEDDEDDDDDYEHPDDYYEGQDGDDEHEGSAQDYQTHEHGDKNGG